MSILNDLRILLLSFKNKIKRFLRYRAAKKLLKQNPSRRELHDIIYYIPSLRQKAWKQYSQFEVSNIELRIILIMLQDLTQECKEAGQKLLKQDPDIDDLSIIFQWVAELRTEVWEMWTQKYTTISDLQSIINRMEDVRKRESNDLYRNDLINNDFCIDNENIGKIFILDKLIKDTKKILKKK